MSNRTAPINRSPLANFTVDIGDGPLAQSILALSNSSLLSTFLSYLGYCAVGLLTFWIHGIPTTLAAVESSPDAIQSLKKSDDQNNVPFDQEEKIQAALQKATSAQPETSTKATAITSSLRRTVRYWLAVRGNINGLVYGSHLCLLFLALESIENETKLAVTSRLTGLKIKQSLPLYIPAKTVVNVPATFIKIAFNLLVMPLSVTWSWHILKLRTSSLHPRTQWPPLQRLLSVRGISSLARQMPLPLLPSKEALRHMLLPTLICSVVQQIGRFYPDSVFHILFVAINGPNALPNVLVAAAIVAESTATTVLFYIIPCLVGELVTWVEASLLPEDELPVIPLDRTFGLKPKQRQNPGISLVDAWRSMSWATLWRIVLMHVKTLALFWGIIFPGGLLIGAGHALAIGVQQHNNQRLNL